MTPAGFPHSEISGSKVVCTSPKLIAAYHVLHRLLTPRHPPDALSSLTEQQCSIARLFQDPKVPVDTVISLCSCQRTKRRAGLAAPTSAQLKAAADDSRPSKAHVRNPPSTLK